jgi:hypothetical protein
MLCSAISSGVHGRYGDIDGVWTAPVMAQLMMVFLLMRCLVGQWTKN